MDTAFLVTTMTTILLAFIGYIATYINNLRTSQLTEQLERVNKQLNELYGPLFAISQANHISWQAFRAKYRPGRAFFGEGNPPTEDELEIWRLWIRTVFMPNNTRMYEAIISKSDLLIEEKMPDCLLLFCAHISAYQSILKRWEDKDFTEHTSIVNYPGQELLSYCQNSFQALKTEQAQLLGKKTSLRSRIKAAILSYTKAKGGSK